jgi:pimeloyl-ACP methyl ester carboxylesterase
MKHIGKQCVLGLSSKESKEVSRQVQKLKQYYEDPHVSLTLIGHSYGGLIASQVAKHIPAHFKSKVSLFTCGSIYVPHMIQGLRSEHHFMKPADVALRCNYLTQPRDLGRLVHNATEDSQLSDQRRLADFIDDWYKTYSPTKHIHWLVKDPQHIDKLSGLSLVGTKKEWDIHNSYGDRLDGGLLWWVPTSVQGDFREMNSI